LTAFEQLNEGGAMSQLTVIAKLKAKGGTEEKLYEECRKLIAPTLGEEGCMNYDLYRSTEDPGTFMSYENWASRPLWESVWSLRT
jgi:quinol monooxygenase YgiN